MPMNTIFSRQTSIGNLFAQLCGTESAMVVNNCSSAVLLVLSALATGQGVAISRSELVEIGGSFRVPEILELSGAYLVEVGTTNKTRVVDYQKAIERYVFCNETSTQAYSGAYGQQPYRWLQMYFIIKQAFALKEQELINKAKKK